MAIPERTNGVSMMMMMVVVVVQIMVVTSKKCTQDFIPELHYYGGGGRLRSSNDRNDHNYRNYRGALGLRDYQRDPGLRRSIAFGTGFSVLSCKVWSNSSLMVARCTSSIY